MKIKIIAIMLLIAVACLLLGVFTNDAESDSKRTNRPFSKIPERVNSK